MKKLQNGVSLVEIMVAVTIGMIGILIITQAYLTSDRFNRATLGEGGAQINGLIALYTLERESRMAGYGIASSAALGCGNIEWYYDPDYSGNIGGSLPNIQLAPIVITTDGTAPFTDPDQITVMFATDADRMFPSTITNFNPSSSEVTVDGTFGFQDGDLILMVGASGCTLGKITQVQAGPQKLQLNPGISAPYNPPSWGSFTTTYGNGDSMVNLGNPIVRIYSVAGRKLQVVDTLLQAGGAPAIDLVEGIVDLRAQYGKDTNADGVIDQWDTATPTDSAGWTGVLSLRLAVLARISDYEKPSGGDCTATTAIPTWTGSVASSPSVANPFAAISVATGSEDKCYRYRVFETTVPLRNMIWRAI